MTFVGTIDQNNEILFFSPDRFNLLRTNPPLLSQTPLIQSTPIKAQGSITQPCSPTFVQISSSPLVDLNEFSETRTITQKEQNISHSKIHFEECTYKHNLIQKPHVHSHLNIKEIDKEAEVVIAPYQEKELQQIIAVQSDLIVTLQQQLEWHRKELEQRQSTFQIQNTRKNYNENQDEDQNQLMIKEFDINKDEVETNFGSLATNNSVQSMNQSQSEKLSVNNNDKDSYNWDNIEQQSQIDENKTNITSISEQQLKKSRDKNQTYNNRYFQHSLPPRRSSTQMIKIRTSHPSKISLWTKLKHLFRWGRK